MMDEWRRIIVDRALPDRVKDKIDNLSLTLNSAGYDRWGLSPSTIREAMTLCHWIYSHYFRVETKGSEHIPKGPVMLVANHGGQIPIDGFLIALSLLLDGSPPRVVRGMVDDWVPSLPFVGKLYTECGEVVGSPENCEDMLDHGEAVLVFPEGVRGSGKPFSKRYQLQEFGTGFMRIALEKKVPMIPVAVIGTEEAYPALGNFKPLAKLLKFPYFPITPFFPWLGPLGALPLPCKVRIRYGEPLNFQADPDISESELHLLIEEVKANLKKEIDKELRIRRGRWFT